MQNHGYIQYKVEYYDCIVWKSCIKPIMCCPNSLYFTEENLLRLLDSWKVVYIHSWYISCTMRFVFFVCFFFLFFFFLQSWLKIRPPSCPSFLPKPAQFPLVPWLFNYILGSAAANFLGMAPHIGPADYHLWAILLRSLFTDKKSANMHF